MENTTRQMFDRYIAQQAQINGVSTAAVAAKFAVDPTRQQRLEQAAQQDNSFLSKINVFGVSQQTGQKVLIGSIRPDGWRKQQRHPSPQPGLKSFHGAVQLHVPQDQL